MCASCAHRACDRSAIVFKKGPARPEFSQTQSVKLPGAYCAPAAWLVIFHAMRTCAEYIGGEVQPVWAFAPLPAL